MTLHRSFSAVLLCASLVSSAPTSALAEYQAPEEPDPYEFVRRVLHSSGDATGVALCEQHLAIVEMGLPDPGRADRGGSRFARAAERQQMLQLLFHGARSSGDPADALAHVMVLLAMLDGAAYVDAVTNVFAAMTSAPPREFDCDLSLDEQLLVPPGIAATGVPEQERQAFIMSCGSQMSQLELMDQQSQMLDQMLYAISEIYEVPLIGGGDVLGATSGGGDSGPPRYVVKYTDANGDVQVRPLTNSVLSSAEKAYSYRDNQAQFIDSMNRGIGVWNAGASSLAGRYPLMGMAHLPSASVGGTAMSAVSNMRNGFKAGTQGTANMNARMGIAGLLIEAVKPGNTATATQEKGSVLNALRPESGGARPSGIDRAEEVMTGVLGSNATIEPAPNQSTDQPEVDDPPLMCPAGPHDPFAGPGMYVDCDQTAGALEPVVPASCQAVIAEVDRQYRQGYEWAPGDLSGPELPFGDSDFTLRCDDTGSNPSHCSEPGPYNPPLDLPVWDGNHYTQESEEAKGRLDSLLGR